MIRTMQDILEIENDKEILSYRCAETGFLLWPLIRVPFLRFIISDIFYTTPIITEKLKPHPRGAYYFLLRALAHNIQKRRNLRGPVLISASGSHILRDRRYFNRLSDHFALTALDQTVTMEAPFTDWHWPFPRYNEKVFFDASILAVSSLYGKFFVSENHEKSAKALVDFAARKAANLIGWSLSEVRSGYLITTLARHIATLPMKRRLYSRLFQRMGTKILIREEGCYSGSSVINRTAIDCGVITAEYQHGMISSGHDAYNFSEVLRSSEEFKKTLPQYFLGYGKWWTDQINAPLLKLNIGNPGRTEFLKDLSEKNCEKTDIVVLGDGNETEKYLSMATMLAKKLGSKHRIVFRPHPLERERVLRIYGQSVGAVAIEWEKGICEAFEAADTVVSEASTGLFEAIGIVNRIFRWDTPKANFASPAHPFETFSDVDELVAKILDGNLGRVNPSMAEDFWAPNWRQNYLAFLQSVCSEIII